jgi:hypothetical protein
MVWQRARYGQICYAAFVPFNPRTRAQMAVRGTFGAVSARWRTLAEAQRKIWCATAGKMKSRPRLLQCGRLTGFLLFVKVNVALANRGIPQVDLPLEYPLSSKPAVSCPFGTSRFGQALVGPVFFLRAKQLLAGWQHDRGKLSLLEPALSG